MCTLNGPVSSSTIFKKNVNFNNSGRTEKGRQGIDCRHCPLPANVIVFTPCVIKICKSVYDALHDLPIQYGFHIVANRRLFTQNCFIH